MGALDVSGRLSLGSIFDNRVSFGLVVIIGFMLSHMSVLGSFDDLSLVLMEELELGVYS